MAQFRAMTDAGLHDVAEAVRQVQTERAIAAGDLDAVIANAFEIGFGRDGLGVAPWTEGNLVVCPVAHQSPVPLRQRRRRVGLGLGTARP